MRLPPSTVCIPRCYAQLTALEPMGSFEDPTSALRVRHSKPPELHRQNISWPVLLPGGPVPAQLRREGVLCWRLTQWHFYHVCFGVYCFPLFIAPLKRLSIGLNLSPCSVSRGSQEVGFLSSLAAFNVTSKPLRPHLEILASPMLSYVARSVMPI